MRPPFDRSASTLAAVAVLMLALTGCGQPADPKATTSAPAAPAATESASADREGLVDIGGGRELFLRCAGSGAPTVMMISGTRGAADEWDTLLPDAAPGAVSTFEAVSETTRVCAYDRPGTTTASDEPTSSTSVPQPTTALQGAEDLHAVLTSAGEEGPYVVVGLSLGGMIAQQYARSYPDGIEGIVLLDSASEYLQTTFTTEQWAAWMAAIAQGVDALGSEAPAYELSIAALKDTPPLPDIPAVVMSSDHPWDLQVTPGDSTWPGWVAAQAALTESIDAEHITRTDSGHGLPVEQPALVTAAILDIVEQARSRG